MSDSLLPHNATAQERALEAVVGPPLFTKAPLREIWDPDRCPAELLPWLAFAMSVDEWDPTWPEDAKREVIRRSFAVHQRKGTRGAVLSSLAAVFGVAQVSEWFEFGGRPHTFRVRISGSVKASRSIARASEIVRQNKPVRSHLEALEVLSPADVSLTLGLAVQTRVTQAVPVDFPEVVAPQFLGFGVHSAMKQQIEAVHG